MNSLRINKVNKIFEQINGYENRAAPSSLFYELMNLGEKYPNETLDNIVKYNYLFDIDYSNYAGYIISHISPNIPDKCQKFLLHNYIFGAPFEIQSFPNYNPGYICLALAKLQTTQMIPAEFLELLKSIEWHPYEIFPNIENRFDIKDINKIVSTLWNFVDTSIENNDIKSDNTFKEEYLDTDDNRLTILASVVLIFKFLRYFWKKHDSNTGKSIDEFYELIQRIWFNCPIPMVQSTIAKLIGEIGNDIEYDAVKDLLAGLVSKNINVIFSICDSISKIRPKNSEQVILELSNLLKNDFHNTHYYDGFVTTTDPFQIKNMLLPKISRSLITLRPNSDKIAIPIIFDIMKENADNVVGMQMAISLIGFNLPKPDEVIPILITSLDNPFLVDEVIMAIKKFRPHYIGKIFYKLENFSHDKIINSDSILKMNFREVLEYYRYKPK